MPFGDVPESHLCTVAKETVPGDEGMAEGNRECL